MAGEKLPQRRQLPHFPSVERHNRAIIHFVTVCTKNRKALLASEKIHHLLLSAWREADHFRVGRYVILPDHLHLFCEPARPSAGYLESWVRYWKSLVSRHLPMIEEGQLWQRDFWDRQLRQTENYETQWEYVRFNPVRHKLVANTDDWPYQGEIHPLEWHD